jgi:Zn-dependent M28 family amino/carboxypeptidase
VAASFAWAATAAAAPNNNNSDKLRKAVSAAGIMEHARAFQQIADANGGARVSGTSGYDASAQYVADRAARAGLNVSFQEFEYEYGLLDIIPPILRRVSPAPARDYEAGLFAGFFGGDFGSMFPSPDGDVTAKIWSVDLNLNPPAAINSNSSGCESGDFTGMPAGSIALIQRGTCNFAVKFANARTAGAGAVVVFNEGNPGVADRQESVLVDGSSLVDIPGASADFRVGRELANGIANGDTGTTGRVRVDQFQGNLTTTNVIAETRHGRPDNVIVVGAHLDSVPLGPGINDNGSGSGGILEIAEQLEKTRPHNKLRFMWFGAEESGLLGSQFYIDSLPDTERDKIAAMLNFDMIGSPNYVRFVYDGDLSDSEPPEGGAPEASAAIEDLFLDYFAKQRLATAPTAFDGRSDYGPFIFAGIPAGGLFTGAEGIKTAEEAAIFGGVAGQQYDPCYHIFCDTQSNINLKGLEEMADAAAHATISLAQSTRVLEGRPGKGHAHPHGPERPSAQAVRSR